MRSRELVMGVGVAILFVAATACGDSATTKDTTASGTSGPSGPGSGGGGAGATGGAGGDSGGSGGADPTGPTPEQTAACVESWTHTCSKYAECFPEFLTVLYGDEETCVQRQAAQCAQVVFAPGSNADPASLPACGAGIAQLSCGDFARAIYTNIGAPAACQPPPGTVALGGPCVHPAQCESQACDVPMGATCGQCIERAPLGESCASPAGCEKDLLCDGTACVALKDVGEACTSDFECHVDLACVGGACGDRLADGETCIPFPNGDQCQMQHYCNPVAKVCESVAQNMEGDDCGLSATGSLSVCLHGASCEVTNPVTYAGKCQPTLADGEACSGNWVTGPCEVPAKCLDDTCQLIDGYTCE